jgi:hypothetical protein
MEIDQRQDLLTGGIEYPLTFDRFTHCNLRATGTRVEQVWFGGEGGI